MFATSYWSWNYRHLSIFTMCLSLSLFYLLLVLGQLWQYLTELRIFLQECLFYHNKLNYIVLFTVHPDEQEGL